MARGVQIVSRFEYVFALGLILRYFRVRLQGRAKRTRRSTRSLSLRHLPSTHCECIREMGRESLSIYYFNVSLILFHVHVACTV
jgi:hypothetical protein